MISKQGSGQDPRTDADLVTAYRDGDETAAAELYRRHYLRLVRGLVAKVPSYEVAEDCVGTAFLKVFEIIRRGKGPTTNVFGYLWSTVTTESANFYRANRPLVTFDEYEEPADPHSSGVEVQSRIDAPSVHFALRALPDHWRQLITLRYVENKMPVEMAEILDAEVPALRKMLHRAKNGLRDAYLKQLVVNRSVGSCRQYSDDLTNYATQRLKAKRVAALEAHLATCSDCQRNYDEVQYQWHRMTPQALGLTLILGGIGGGSALTLGGVGEAHAAAAKTGLMASKLLPVSGAFQVLGTAGTVTLASVAVVSLALGTWIASSAVSSADRADPEPTTISADSGSDTPPSQTISTTDGDCDLTVTVHDGALRAEARVNSGECWLSYQHVGSAPRPEVAVDTGWIIVTRVHGTHKFDFRSEEDSTSYTVTL